MGVNISKSQMQNAKDYLTLAEKESILARAPMCVDRLLIKDGDEVMPPMWKENSGIKARYLMAALVSYFEIGYEHDADDEVLMSVSDYDSFAGSHFLMQIERWKKCAETRDKAYNILYDYRTIERTFNAEIRAYLDVRNDTVIRQQQLMQKETEKLGPLLHEMVEMQKPQTGEAVESGA